MADYREWTCEQGHGNGNWSGQAPSKCNAMVRGVPCPAPIIVPQPRKKVSA